MAFERIVNLPRRGIGPATMQILHGLARARRISLTASVVRLLDTDELQPRARTTLRRLFEDFERWRALAGTAPPAELAAQVLDESGYTAMWKASKAIEAPGKLDNLKELVAALDDYHGLGEFLEHVSLVMDNVAAGDGEKVTLMTLHSAKGLEFDTVFLPGWEEGLFPHPRALDEGGTGGLEEERRLAYVGLTRARRRVLVSFAASRRLYGQWQSAVPSRFIDELPPDHLDQEAEPGLYGSAQGSNRGSGDGLATFAPSFRRRRRARLVEDAAWREEPESRAEDSFETGQRVFHQKFGYGRILARDGDKLEISFEKAGTKRVVNSFVEAV
jgi:DNA helicase-2/ATP-dependent DNA helicase PcrA